MQDHTFRKFYNSQNRHISDAMSVSDIASEIRYLCTQFHIPYSDTQLVIAIKVEETSKFHTTSMLQLYDLQNYVPSQQRFNIFLKVSYHTPLQYPTVNSARTAFS